MEAIPEVEFDLLGHSLLDVRANRLGILSKKLCEAEAHNALEVDALVSFLFEERSTSL